MPAPERIIQLGELRRVYRLGVFQSSHSYDANINAIQIGKRRNTVFSDATGHEFQLGEDALLEGIIRICGRVLPGLGEASMKNFKKLGFRIDKRGFHVLTTSISRKVSMFGFLSE